MQTTNVQTLLYSLYKLVCTRFLCENSGICARNSNKIESILYSLQLIRKTIVKQLKKSELQNKRLVRTLLLLELRINFLSKVKNSYRFCLNFELFLINLTRSTRNLQINFKFFKFRNIQMSINLTSRVLDT